MTAGIGGLLITGTGTEVGKTLVASALFRSLLRRGVRTTAIKPVQTGCLRCADGDLSAPDTEMYHRAASGLTGGEIRVCRCFEPACSPHLAARLANSRISTSALVREVHSVLARGRYGLVEGAGGIMVPLTETYTFRDLARDLNLPVLIVCDNRLGVINHTLLTIEALRSAGVGIAGVVMNHVTPTTEANRYIRRDNPEIIASMGNVRILGQIPFMENWAPDSGTFWSGVEQTIWSATARICEI